MSIAIKQSGYASQPRVEIITGFDEPLAGRNLGSQCHAFRTLGITVNGVRTFANIVCNCAHLDVGVCLSVRKDERLEVDLVESWLRVLVLLVDD